jgi:hypothetical protein
MKSATLLLMAVLFVSTAQAANQAEMPPLSAHEAEALAFVLQTAPLGSMTVICEGAWCRKLADGIGNVFAAANWSVSKSSSGTILEVSGMPHGSPARSIAQGIRVKSCGLLPAQVSDLMEWATARKVYTLDDGPCIAGGQQIFLIIGAPEA